MACRFSHASATPSSIDLPLIEMSMEPAVPKKQHQTDYGVILQYIIGVSVRKGSLTVMVTTPTEHSNFLAFYKTASNANSRFTFVADQTNFPSDTFSAYFTSEPKFEYRRMPAGRIVATFRVDIQDAPVTL